MLKLTSPNYGNNTSNNSDANGDNNDNGDDDRDDGKTDINTTNKLYEAESVSERSRVASYYVSEAKLFAQTWRAKVNLEGTKESNS